MGMIFYREPRDQGVLISMASFSMQIIIQLEGVNKENYIDQR